MLKKIEESTLFGIAAIVVTAIGAVEFWRNAVAPHFAKGM